MWISLPCAPRASPAVKASSTILGTEPDSPRCLPVGFTVGTGGGDRADEDSSEKKDSFHVGRFRGIKDASALRDKLRQRLREAQSKPEPAAAETPASDGDLHAAASEPLDEARALRQSFAG